MQKRIALLCCLLLTALLAGCAAGAEQLTGEAEGYGGTLRVSVTMSGSDITSVTVESHQETQGVGTRAIDALPDRIVQADSVEVEGVSGATITSNAIKEAVAQAMGVTAETGMTPPEATSAPETEALRGTGMAATGRLGPGTSEDGSPVYSFNVVFASADFDAEGRILRLDVEQLEVLSTQFDGFPVEEGEREADFLSQVREWTPKGAKGDAYMLGSGSWREQMDAYQQMMVGKTMAEVEGWFQQSFSEETGKPMAETAQTDGMAGATMSLRDEHGDILTAIQRAWEDAQRRAPADSATPTDVAPGDGPTGSPAPLEDGMMNDTNTQEELGDGEDAFG